MSIVVVTRNAQVTIPKSVRQALGIREGGRVIVKVDEGRIVMEKVENDVWLDPTDFLPEDFDKYWLSSV